MPKLSPQVQTFIVLRLAQFATPTEVVELVKEEFGIELSRQSVHHYDPVHGKPAPHWRALYAQERARFIQATDEIGVSHLAFRLHRLDRMLRKAERQGNLPVARELLETAAKDAGGAFTSKRTMAVGVGTIDQLLAAVEAEDEADAEPAAGGG